VSSLPKLGAAPGRSLRGGANYRFGDPIHPKGTVPVLPIITAVGVPTQPTGFAVIDDAHIGLEQRAERVLSTLLALLDDLRTQAEPDDVPIADAAFVTASFLSAGVRSLVVRSRQRATTIRPRTR
jgi:hypothetical protein